MTGETLFHVAIIGGGACGLAILLNIVERGTSGMKIAIFEKASTIGPGLAYSQSCIGTRVNMTARSMSLYTNDTDHFDRWMRENPNVPGGEDFPPREYFGRYLVSVMASVTKQAQEKGIDLVVYHTEVLDMEQRPSGWLLHTGIGASIEARDVTLALGNHMSQIHKHLNSKPLYFGNPWPIDRLLVIPKTSSIAILGSRLTAIDEALFLTDRGYNGQIYLLSRTGQLPKVQAKGGQKPERAWAVHNLAREVEKNPAGAIITIARRLHDEMTMSNNDQRASWVHNSQTQDVLTTFRRDVETARTGNVPGQAILRETAPIIERYWKCLDAFNQQTFLREYMSTWTTHRHAMPCRTGERVLRLLESGQMKVLRVNTKKTITYHDTTFAIPVLTTDGAIHVDALIEATGMEYDATSIETPLMRNLLSRQILTAHPNGGVYCDTQTLRANKGLYIIGSMTRGVHFYSTAIDRNVPHAGRIVDSILGLPPRRPLHVALFVGSDLFSQLQASQIVGPLIAAGSQPFVYVVEEKSIGPDQSFASREADFYERRLLRETVIPHLGKGAAITRPCLTIRQLHARHGVLVQDVSDINDTEFVRSLAANHIDVGFALGCCQTFESQIVQYFNDREGLAALQPNAGQWKFGCSLRRVEQDPEAGKLLDAQHRSTDESEEVLNTTDNTWQTGAEMIIKHIDILSRGLPVPTSNVPLAGISNSGPAYGDINHVSRGLRRDEIANIKCTLVQSFATEGETEVLSTIVESACRVWHQENSDLGSGYLEKSFDTLVNVSEISSTASSTASSSAPTTVKAMQMNEKVVNAAVSKQSSRRTRWRISMQSWSRVWRGAINSVPQPAQRVV